MRIAPPSLGVAGRLSLLLGGLAAISTGLALALQDRALDQDLRAAAVARLENSASVVDRLIGEHARSVATRYSAISRTPEFRANLDTQHEPTLAFHAREILSDQNATLIAFLGAEGDFVTTAGDPRLTDVARRRMLAEAPASGCVRAAASTATARQWVPCIYPDGRGEASLIRVAGDLYTFVTVPLRTGGDLDGALLALEHLSASVLRDWSELAGVEVRIGSTAALDTLTAMARDLDGRHVYVSTTYDAEQQIIDRSRRNLVISGVLAALLAVIASLALARRFARPIVAMREATARLSEGDLDHRVSVERGDELGELGQAFNDLASRLTDSQKTAQRAQRRARYGNWTLDLESDEFDGTKEFRRLLALSETDPIPFRDLAAQVHPEDRNEFRTAFEEGVRDWMPFRVEVRVRVRGQERVMDVRGNAVRHSKTRVEGSIQDVTQARKAEEQIRYLSMYDPITRLGNRDHAIAELRRRTEEDAETELTLVVVGIDDLHGVINTYGHAAGDTVLMDVARRLLNVRRRESREHETDEDLVAKLGEDRFLVVFQDTADPEVAEKTAHRVTESLSGTYALDDDEVTLTASLGVALWPTDGEDADTLLRNGEAALSRAQQDERGSVRFYDESIHEDASRRLRLANSLRRAIESGEGLELHYQPRVQPENGRLVGFEGLARWTHPELGPISPGEFIPIAEATGSIEGLGTWVIRTAAAQTRTWHEAGFDWLSVSVNLSQRQLRPELVDFVVKTTKGLDRSLFELEVTESALIEEGDSAIQTLSSLRANGFLIALDDFGTGYSSLSYLQGLPIDTVKVDRGFIRHVAEDPDAAALTGSVLAMCRALRLHTVVEGVETAEQLETLISLGSTEVQGFLFSKPLALTDATEYLANAVPGDRPQTADLPI